MAIEMERKYIGMNDFDWLRERLINVDASSSGIHFEKNIIFDTKDHTLFNDGKLLRLRTQIWKNRSSNILTLKLPAHDREGVKVREEREIAIDNYQSIVNVFLGLGYEICATYEKFREHWVHEQFCLDIDILPFIKCVEVEADVEKINFAEQLLGLGIYKKSTKTYHDLHKEWCINNGIPHELSFIFEDSERNTLIKKLL